jgi:uncharacterized protein YuzE
MKVIYDKETDTLSIIFSEAKVADSDEVREGLILDYDKAGRLVSLELLDASERWLLPILPRSFARNRQSHTGSKRRALSLIW